MNKIKITVELTNETETVCYSKHVTGYISRYNTDKAGDVLYSQVTSFTAELITKLRTENKL